MEKNNPHTGNGQPPDGEAAPASTGGSAQPSPRARRVSALAIVVGALLGIVAGSIAVFIYLVITARQGAPLLTPAAYETAERRWKANGPVDYNLDLVLTGRQTGEIHVEVRARQVTKMTRNGIEPKRRATWDYWSVDSQFEIIGRELEMARDPETRFDAPPGSSVVLRAEFDPRLGYPREYQRMVLGTTLEIRWQVTHFEALATRAAAGE